MYQTRKEVENWLIEMGVENYVINEDLTVDVNGNVIILFKSLNKIPIKFNIINGNFNCSKNKLTSLEGCLKEVNGDFDCNNNDLTNLKGCPKRVNGYFSCSVNQIKNLTDCPEVINRHFLCYSNNLTSLLGCTEVINGDFYCGDNKLTSLEYFPKEIKGEYIYMNGNNIREEELVNLNCDIKNVNYIYSDFNKNGDKEEFLEKVKFYQKIKRENELLKELSVNSNNIKLNKKL